MCLFRKKNKYNHKFNFLISSLLLLSIGCSSGVEKKIVSKYPNGTPCVIEYVKKNSGKEEIIKIERFYSNGDKELEGSFKNNKKDGLWINWYSNGEKWKEEKFKDGFRDGEFTVWHENGNKNYKGNYSKGLPSGKWTFWDNNGKFLSEKKY